MIHREQILAAPIFMLLFGVLAMLVGGLLVLSIPPTASANDCQLYRDDEHMQLESLFKSRQFSNALEIAKTLHRHYDECQKAPSTDAESRVMNQSWRADTAISMAQIYRSMKRAQEARQWVREACKDYRVVVDATIVDTQTRKMANKATERNCGR